MKISTKLLIAVVIPTLMALVVLAVLFFSYREMNKIQANGSVVRDIRSSIRELNHAVFSYVLYHEERPKQQFVAEYDIITALIDSAQLENTEQQHLLESIRQSTLAMKDSFLQLVANNERSATLGVDEHQAAEDRLTGILLLRSYEADSDAAILRGLVDDGIRVTELRTIGLILLMVVLAMLALTLVLARMRKYIVSSLSNLVEGTATVGSGNLDYTLPEKANDEIGILSRAFNLMTINLKTVTASKTDLEKEISARKDAEEELRTANEHLQEQAVKLEEEVNERKKIEEALQHYTSNLETANKELEAFSYSVSHDLRQPLRALDGFSEAVLIEYGDKLDDTGKDYLNRVRRASQTMGQLIDDMLKLSRISRAEMHRENIDLSNLVKSIIDELQATQPERRVNYAIIPLALGNGDRNLLQICLRNLLENAWKFTSKCPDPKIEFGFLNQNGEKVYYIKDNGAGFNMAYADKLFQPFQRLHTSADYPGTGIGLATVQRVIRRHSGRIWAESQIGQGTTFYFTLGA